MITQPYGNGCVFWLGMDNDQNYVNLITETVLTNAGVDTDGLSYDLDGYPSVPVFHNTNRVGAYIRSGFSFNGTTDYSIAFYVKNPTIESAFNDEEVISNTNRTSGVGEIHAIYHKTGNYFAVGSESSTMVQFSSVDGIDITDWLKVVITSNAATGLKTVVVNGVEKSYTASPYEPYGPSYEIGIFNTTWNTGAYQMSLNGALADVRFYDRVLTPEEIVGGSSSTIILTLSKLSGVYPESYQISIAKSVSEATIYYTTDGSTPTTSSIIYSGAIDMFTGTLKAYAVADGYPDSAVVSATYAINNDIVPTLESDYTISGTADVVAGTNTVEIYSDGDCNASLIKLIIGMTLSNFMTSGTTTIDGGMITTGSITADKLVVGALRITDSLQLDDGVVITGSIGENQVTTIASANVSDGADVSLSIETTESTQKIIVWFSCTLFVDDDASDAEYTISHGSTELMRAFWSTKGTLAFSKSIVYSPGSAGTITFTGANLSDSGCTVTDKTIVLLVCKR